MTQFDRRRFVQVGLAGGAAAAVTEHWLGDSSALGDELSEIGKTAHTKFAVNVEMWWHKLPFLDRLRKVSEFGFPAFEFWPYENKDIAAIADLSQAKGIAVAQFTAWGFQPGMNDPRQENHFVEKIEEACGIAHQLNCSKMTVVAGNDQDGMTKAEMHKQVIKALRRAAPIAEREKVMLILEPMNGRVDHPGHCLYGSGDAIAICRAVDSPFVKINWDLYHMQISEGDLCGHLRDGIDQDQVGYLQLADHPGRNEPGTGEIHYNRVLREALALGYDGYVGLECRPRTTELAAAKGVAAADVW